MTSPAGSVPPVVADGTFVSRDPAALATPLDDGLLVMSVEQARYFRLDDIGRAIWEQLDAPCAFETLVDRIEAAYDAPRQTVANDVAGWLRRMAVGKIIHLAGDGGVTEGCSSWPAEELHERTER